MKLTFANARKCQQFSAIFANLKAFTENVAIYFKTTGLYIQCLDDSHCAIFECQLSKSWFKTYSFDPENDLGQIAVNIPMLNKVLNAWTDPQELSIETQPGTDKLYINFENANMVNQFSKYFELSLIDLDVQLLDVVVTETTVDVTIETKIFCALISQLSIFDTTLTMTFNEENIECMSSGSDGSMRALIKVDEVKEYAIPESTVLKQSYSLRYVQMMCQFNKLGTEMVLGFVDERPMVMTYALGDNNDEESFVRILLAPKIPDNDNE